MAYWLKLHSDPGAVFDATVRLDAAEILPQVTWGTSPEMVTSIEGTVPDPAKETDPIRRNAIVRALEYMDLKPNMPITSIGID